jgi:hypothetical protein
MMAVYRTIENCNQPKILPKVLRTLLVFFWLTIYLNTFILKEGI